jgi:hypothetical protein
MGDLPDHEFRGNQYKDGGGVSQTRTDPKVSRGDYLKGKTPSEVPGKTEVDPVALKSIKSDLMMGRPVSNVVLEVRDSANMFMSDKALNALSSAAASKLFDKMVTVRVLVEKHIEGNAYKVKSLTPGMVVMGFGSRLSMGATRAWK